MAEAMTSYLTDDAALSGTDDALHRTPVALRMADAYRPDLKERAMNLFALVSWIIVGCLIGLILAAVWRTRGLTLAWGFAAGGVGGVVGGLIGRTLFPAHLGTGALPLFTAILGGFAAMGIARAVLAKEHSPSS
jgi:hypothetical protein